MPKTGTSLSKIVGVQPRRIDGIHRLGAPAENDRLRFAGQNVRRRKGVRNDLRVDPRPSDPVRDQLRVVGAEVHHEDQIVLGAQQNPFDVATSYPSQGDRSRRASASPACRPRPGSLKNGTAITLTVGTSASLTHQIQQSRCVRRQRGASPIRLRPARRTLAERNHGPALRHIGPDREAVSWPNDTHALFGCNVTCP